LRSERTGKRRAGLRPFFTMSVCVSAAISTIGPLRAGRSRIGPTAAATARPTPVAATATPRPSPTLTPTPTPVHTPVGTFYDPIIVACDGLYLDDTATFPAQIAGYGWCDTGLTGPEVVYRLDLDSRLETLALEFGAAADLRLLVLVEANPATCLYRVLPGTSLEVHDVPPDSYYLIVDGTMAGDYALAIHCRAVTAPAPRDAPVTGTIRGQGLHESKGS